MSIARATGTEEFLLHRFAGTVAAGAPLVVGAADAAVLVRGGQVIRVIGPGEYGVPAELAGPDVAAYFVRTAPIGVKFGGPIPARPGGPRMVYGELQIQPADPVAAVVQLAAIGDGATAMTWIKSQIQLAAAAAVVGGAADPSALGARAGEVLARVGLAVVGVAAFGAR